MKRKIFSILLALVLVLSFSLIPVIPAMAATTYYVATTGNDTTGDGSPSTPWVTISYALTQVVAGDTITVGPGTYLEWTGAVSAGCAVDVPYFAEGTGGLTIQSTGGAANTIIDCGWAAKGVQIISNGVTFSGFTVKNAYTVVGQVGAKNHTLSNLIITDFVNVGLELTAAHNCTFSNITIHGNDVNESENRTVKGIDIQEYGSGGNTNNTFEDITIYGIKTTGAGGTSFGIYWEGDNPDTHPSNGNTFTNVEIYNLTSAYFNCGIYILDGSSTTPTVGHINPYAIENTTFTGGSIHDFTENGDGDVVSRGFYVKGGNKNLDVTGFDITGCDEGFYFKSFDWVQPPAFPPTGWVNNDSWVASTSPRTGTYAAGIEISDYSPPTLDDYLIMPQQSITTGGTVSFYARADFMCGVHFKLLVSTTGTAPGNFTDELGDYLAPAFPDAWSTVSEDLSAYDGQSIYIAIYAYEGVSGPSGSELFIDDVTLPDGSTEGFEGAPATVGAVGVTINYNNIHGNTTYGIDNSSGIGTLDAENNWWGHASGPTHTGNPGGLGDEVSDNVTYDPWIGKTGTNSAHADIGSGAATTLNLTGAGGGSSVYVDMNENESAGFSAVEETGTPTQGFTGMGGGNGIDKSIVITTDADDGDFIAVVKLHYTDAEFTASDILTESAIRLYYWNTEDEKWELAVAGNIGGTIRWMGNSTPWVSPAPSDIGRHGVDEDNNIAWAVVDHATDFGAGEVAVEVLGSFQVGPSPDVTVTFTPSDMNPTVEQTVTVHVSVPEGVDRTLGDVQEIQLKLWYDSDGGIATIFDFEDDALPVSDNLTQRHNDTDTQTYALITWTPTGNFNLYSGGGNTTWSKGTCTAPTLTGTSGDFIFKFTPGKVAKETAGASAIWQIAAKVLNTFPDGFGADVDGAKMNWYGQLSLSQSATVDWGQVHAGMKFGYDQAKETLGANIEYISNGGFNKNAKSSATWESASNTATLDDNGDPDPEHFSLKAYNTDLAKEELNTAAFLNTTGAMFNTGDQTVEAGQEDTVNYLWLELGDTFAEDTYTGTITYIIAPD